MSSPLGPMSHMDQEFTTPKPEPRSSGMIEVYKEEEEEDEEEEDVGSNVENMPEDHGHPGQMSLYSSDFMHGYNNSSIKLTVKKPSGGKRQKADDEEEDVKIETYIDRDVKSISVKDMRKLVPKLRIECFCSEQEFGGKKKMKHLWDQKPATWPEHIPFKDPNNPGKEGSAKKPGKSDLMKMYTYLREVYLRIKGVQSSAFTPGTLSPAHQSSGQSHHHFPLQQYHQETSSQMYFAQFQQLQQSTHYSQQQHNVQQQQHFSSGQTQQFPSSQLAYSPIDEDHHKMSQPESMEEEDVKTLTITANPTGAVGHYTEGQLIPSKVDATITVGGGRYPDMSCVPSPISNGKQRDGYTNSLSSTPEEETPFKVSEVVVQLNERISEKVGIVTKLPGVTEPVKEQLNQVITDVLDRIYVSLTNASFCLMYLDAGHQMEALLDCMIVLEKVEANLLSSGCSEIKKKFQNIEVWHCQSSISKLLLPLDNDFLQVVSAIKPRRDANFTPHISMRHILPEAIDYDKDKKEVEAAPSMNLTFNNNYVNINAQEMKKVEECLLYVKVKDQVDMQGIQETMDLTMDLTEADNPYSTRMTDYGSVGDHSLVSQSGSDLLNTDSESPGYSQEEVYQEVQDNISDFEDLFTSEDLLQLSLFADEFTEYSQVQQQPQFQMDQQQPQFQMDQQQPQYPSGQQQFSWPSQIEADNTGYLAENRLQLSSSNPLLVPFENSTNFLLPDSQNMTLNKMGIISRKRVHGEPSPVLASGCISDISRPWSSSPSSSRGSPSGGSLEVRASVEEQRGGSMPIFSPVASSIPTFVERMNIEDFDATEKSSKMKRSKKK